MWAHFAKEIRSVTHECSPSSHLNPGIQMGLSRKICGGHASVSCIGGSFWEFYPSRNTTCLDWKRRKLGQQGLHGSWVWGQWGLCRTGGQSIKPQRIILGPWDLVEFALLGFRLALDPWPLYSFQFLPLVMGMSILWLSHYCILKADNLFSSFTVHRWRFSSGCTIPRVSLMSNLDGLENKI